MKVYVTFEYDTPPCSAFARQDDADDHVHKASVLKTLACRCCFVDEKQVSPGTEPGNSGTDPLTREQ